ncbi:M23 family metallopeptidase [Neobacillus cucumis]|nr:M23 family metallopeptidase [Neobacillus cucumis]
MKFRLSGEFGELSPVRGMQPHSGIDLVMKENTTLRAIKDGIVDRVYDGTGNIGKGLSIRLEDGTRAIYGHMNDVAVKIGDHVNAGQVVGISGNTGNSTGPHLHFGLKDSTGHVIDPTPYADDLANMSGDVSWFDKISHIKVTSLGEWISGKIAEFTVNGFVDYLADIALALPVIALVGGCVYACVGMLSKGGAKWAAVTTVIYGLYIAK